MHILSMLYDTLYICFIGKSGNVLKMCWMLFVLQTSPLPGTSVLYLSVALETNLLLLALLGLTVGLAWKMVEIRRLAAWCCLVSILSVCVLGLISVLTDMRCKMKTWLCSIFSGLDKSFVCFLFFYVSLCSMRAILNMKKAAVVLTAYMTALCEQLLPELDHWANDPWRSPGSSTNICFFLLGVFLKDDAVTRVTIIWFEKHSWIKADTEIKTVKRMTSFSSHTVLKDI